MKNGEIYKKGKKRISEVETKKSATFEDTLDKLYDVVPENVLNIL